MSTRDLSDGAPLELLYTPAKNDVTQSYWYVLDGKGNVVALTTASGVVVDRYHYDVWGVPTIDREEVPQPLLYGGYVYDRELSGPGDVTATGQAAGWYWLSVRPYDPSLKRFLQPDPSEQEGTMSYVYAGDDPLDCADPTGLLSWQQIGIGIGVGLFVAASIVVGIASGGVSIAPELGALGGFAEGATDLAAASVGGGMIDVAAGGGLAEGGGFLDASQWPMGLKLGGTILAGGSIGVAAHLGGISILTANGSAAGGVQDVSLPQRGGAAPACVVAEQGVAIPMDPDELVSSLQNLEDRSTSPATSRKYVGVDSNGPVRVCIEQAHAEDPAYTGPQDPLHVVDHLHIDRRLNVTSGAWKSGEKIPYEWPF